MRWIFIVQQPILQNWIFTERLKAQNFTVIGKLVVRAHFALSYKFTSGVFGSCFYAKLLRWLIRITRIDYCVERLLLHHHTINSKLSKLVVETKRLCIMINRSNKFHLQQFFFNVLGTRFGSLELKIGSLGSEKIIIGSLESEKIGSLESEKSGRYRSIPGTYHFP